MVFYLIVSINIFNTIKEGHALTRKYFSDFIEEVKNGREVENLENFYYSTLKHGEKTLDIQATLSKHEK